MASFHDLPREIILHIFRMYLETENQSNFLRKISKVSSSWKELCLDRSLWKKYDGTPPHVKMMVLCKKGCLANTTELIFSSTETLLPQEMITLFPVVNNLKTVDFSKVQNLNENILTTVAEYCRDLHTVTFGDMQKSDEKLKDIPQKQSKTLNYNMLGQFFAIRGKNLIKINLSYCKIPNFTQVIRCIADCCHNLEELHLINITLGSNSYFPIDYVQRNCTKLKVLHLHHLIRLSNKYYSEGFPNLEVFTLPDYNGLAISDSTFLGIVHKSVNLKFLNLSYCNISVETMCSIAASSVECLYIAKSKMCHSKNLCEVLKKWNHSLKEIDIANSCTDYVNKAMLSLIDIPMLSQLEYLNLTGTRISADVIQKLLEKCTKLETIHLDSCRNLGRGMKMVYTGKSQLQILSEKLRSFTADATISAN